MKDSPELESLLRSLAPSELPNDLHQRLATPPAPACGAIIPSRRWWLPVTAALAAGIAWILVIRNTEPPKPRPLQPVSVHQTDSRLVARKSLGLIEKDGRLLQIEERHWHDEETAICSTTPVSVSLGSERIELVYQPVNFD